VSIRTTRASDHAACAIDAIAYASRLERAYALPPGCLVAKGRDGYTVAPRALLAHALRAKGYSYPEIGSAMGGRAHTSVMRMCEKPVQAVRAAARAQLDAANIRQAEATVGAVFTEAGAHKLPPVDGGGYRTAHLETPDKGRAAWDACIETLRGMTDKRARYEVWRVYCRTAFPHTAKWQARTLPREVRA